MATMHIGSFGEDRPDIDADFKYFDKTIRVHPRASDLVFAEFMDQAKRIQVAVSGNGNIEADVASMTTMTDMLRRQVHPDDWDLLWTTAVEHNQQITDLMKLSRSIVEAVAAFPTGQSAGSSGGPSNTDPRSKGNLSVAGGTGVPVRNLQSWREMEQDRAMRLLKGRPDLQNAVMHAIEQQRQGNAEATG